MSPAVDAETYASIEQLQHAYADVVTRGAWDETANLLTPDAHIRFATSSGAVFEVDGAEAFAEFGARMTGVLFSQYIPLTFVVSFTPEGGLEGRTYSLEVIENDAGEWVESYSVYEDAYALTDAGWRFARRSHRTVKRRVTPC